MLQDHGLQYNQERKKDKPIPQLLGLTDGHMLMRLLVLMFSSKYGDINKVQVMNDERVTWGEA